MSMMQTKAGIWAFAFVKWSLLFGLLPHAFEMIDYAELSNFMLLMLFSAVYATMITWLRLREHAKLKAKLQNIDDDFKEVEKV